MSIARVLLVITSVPPSDISVPRQYLYPSVPVARILLFLNSLIRVSRKLQPPSKSPLFPDRASRSAGCRCLTSN
jgi:hypothetical protein